LLESLEAELRALPQPAVPGDLEARILAAAPARARTEAPRVVGRARRVLWATVLAAAAACVLLAIRWRPHAADRQSDSVVQSNSVPTKLDQLATPRPPREAQRFPRWFEAQADTDDSEITPFAWPVRESTPVMASTAGGSELFD
jgi:hypothetical protein